MNLSEQLLKNFEIEQKDTLLEKIFVTKDFKPLFEPLGKRKKKIIFDIYK